MIKLATVFSGIGAVEQALEKKQIDYKIVFAIEEHELLAVDKHNGVIERIPSAAYQKDGFPRPASIGASVNLDINVRPITYGSTAFTIAKQGASFGNYDSGYSEIGIIGKSLFYNHF